jgi:hypothetical protein
VFSTQICAASLCKNVCFYSYVFYAKVDVFLFVVWAKNGSFTHTYVCSLGKNWWFYSCKYTQFMMLKMQNAKK